jgi:hypothetical protein
MYFRRSTLAFWRNLFPPFSRKVSHARNQQEVGSKQSSPAFVSVRSDCPQKLIILFITSSSQVTARSCEYNNMQIGKGRSKNNF